VLPLFRDHLAFEYLVSHLTQHIIANFEKVDIVAGSLASCFPSILPSFDSYSFLPTFLLFPTLSSKEWNPVDF